MKLWIRSQDKEILIKVDRIGIEEFDDGYGIVTYERIGTKNEFGLGLYKSKERALEILDEIQNILKPKYILDSSSIKPNGDSWVENGIVMQKYNANAKIEELSIYVYEMPED